MKERPILFSTPMVQAILNGTKTQTRRVLKPQPNEDGAIYMAHAPLDWESIYKEEWKPWKYDTEAGETIATHCPYGAVGDVIWVRETFGKGRASGFYYYKVYAKEPQPAVTLSHKSFFDKWKPSIHMPKAAACLWLQITGIRVERLQTITEADAKAEGVEWTSMQGYKNYYDVELANPFHFPSSSFKSLWHKINGPESWNANPYVWVIEFKVISKTGKP